MSRQATEAVLLRPRRDVDAGAQSLLVDELSPESSHAGALVETEGAGEAVAVYKELDGCTAASVEFLERALEKREAQTAAAPRRANGEAGDNAAGESERQVWAAEREAGHAVAVPRPPTTTHPG